MHRHYYFDITNQLLAALNSDVADPVVITRLMRTACQGLRQVDVDLDSDGDGDLAWTIEHLREIQSRPELYDRQLRDLRAASSFVEIFLHREFVALDTDGVPDAVNQFIRSQARDVLGSMKSAELPRIDQLRADVQKLRDVVCATSKLLDAREGQIGFLKRATYIFSGAGLMGFNGSVDIATTLGLAPWMTVLSGAVAAIIMGKGF